MNKIALNWFQVRKKNPHSFLSKSGSWPPMKGWLRNVTVSQSVSLPKTATIESAELKQTIEV